MALTDEMDMQGYLTMQLCDERQQIVEEIKIKNAIVADGREIVARQFAGEAIGKVAYLAVGTGGLDDTQTPKLVPAKDNQLEKQLLRKSISGTEVLPYGDGWKVVLTTTLLANEANEALTEAGLFNGPESSKMYNRVTFKPINKSTNFTLTLKWEIIF